MATVRSSNTNSDTGAEGATIIGDSTQVRGNLIGDEDLHVHGRIEGRVELQRTLFIAPSGVVKADVSVKSAVVSGIVVGNIHASESVELTREARMVGDIVSPRVVIAEGASFRGGVDMGDAENMPARRPAAERPRPASAPAARPSTQSARPKPAAVAARTAPPSSIPGPAIRTAEKAAEPAKPTTIVPTKTQPPAAPLEAPAAKGLPQKANKTRVIVKRR